jgi:transglutaminase-like putative cysteine protease
VRRFLPTLSMLAAVSLLAVAGCGDLTASPDGPPAAGDAPSKAARLEPAPAYLLAGEARRFEITYTAQVKEVPEGTEVLRVWVPVPGDSTVQTISGLAFDGDVRPTLTTEKRFGNRLAYYEIRSPGPAFETRVSYAVERKETKADLQKLARDGTETDASVKAFLEPDELVIVDDRIRKIAAEVTEGKATTLEKARAIYDYVAGHMAYDKSGTGWGRGDTNFACDVGKGNCTDFHSLFISLCRAARIPAGFGIGLFPPYERYEGQSLGGYHCWAYFRVPGKSWVPVDISEGWKHDGKRLSYFFGNHTSNRVTLSVGRDLVLEPRQAGPPLNFLLAPYAEADGKPVRASKSWSMADVE